MARAEHDREDLLREATALVERAELQIAGWEEPVVVGFRRNGSFSCYFGGDPVYQFNTAGELRRAFVAGLLYKAESGRLIALQRERNPSETVLFRKACDRAEETNLLTAARERLQTLSLALQGTGITVIGQVSTGGDVVGRVRQWLSTLPAELRVADRPHSG
jgi:hypothetical protein